jgi:hypothetical protein
VSSNEGHAQGKTPGEKPKEETPTSTESRTGFNWRNVFNFSFIRSGGSAFRHDRSDSSLDDRNDQADDEGDDDSPEQPGQPRP